MELLDTTVAVDYLRGRPASVALLTGLRDSRDDVVASELVRFELLAGLRQQASSSSSVVSWPLSNGFP